MNRVVVTGMGAISPVGCDVLSLWENIKNGHCGISPITCFDTEDFKVKVAGQVENFYPSSYMETLEIAHTDLCTQYAIAAASQAVKSSRILEEVEPDRIGVYVGTGIGGIHTFMEEHQKLLERGPRRVSPYFIPMMIANMPSGMIAMRYGCKGPALPAVSACASGCNAIGEAVRMIRHGYTDAMIAGGTEAAINKLALAGFANMKAVSFSENPQEASLPFDARRSGFVMGEGAGILVLEKYEMARKRGAYIYAEISGYGSTCDAYHMTAPHPEAEGGARAIMDAIGESRIATDRIYYNAHGTGTTMNDIAETIALKTVFGEKLAHEICISSTKSMTGHMLGAAGAVEAIISILALTEGIAPPTIGLECADPACDLDYVPGKARKADFDLALSTSFGFGGHNACLAFRKV